MKKAFKIILIVVVALLLLLLALYAYYGGFAKIEITEKETGGEVFIYKEVIGDYNQAGKITNEVYNSLLADYKIETQKGCGIYYDDPKLVDKDKLRSEVGCILEAGDIDKIGGLKSEYKIKILPFGKYVITEFPYKGFPSIIIGIIKVYPKLGEYMIENKINSPIMEVYDIPNNKIIYRTNFPKHLE